MAGEELALCRDLPRDLRLQAAALSFEALPAFYAPLAKAAAVEAIASEFATIDSEVHGAEAAIVDGTVAGVVAGYPAAELASRQRVSLYHMLSSLASDDIGPFVAHVRSFAADIPLLPSHGRYLARLAVADEQRGTGLADRLLGKFLTDSGGSGASLHVAAGNARAIAFYRRRGFRVGSQDLPYIVLQRP